MKQRLKIGRMEIDVKGETGTTRSRPGRQTCTKNRTTVQRSLKALRAIIDDPLTDVVTRDVAHAIETAILWMTLDTRGWERPERMAREKAADLREALADEAQKQGGKG